MAFHRECVKAHADPQAPVPNPAVACRPADDGWMVLVNLDTGRSLALNPTAATIWRLVDGARAPGEIAAELREVFTDAPADLLDDVRQVLSSLSETGLVGYSVAVRRQAGGRRG